MMKMIRNSKCLMIALILSLMFVLFFAQAAFASEVRLSASQETGSAGDTVTVTVSIADALGTEGGQFDLSYGPTMAGGTLMLEAVAIRNGNFVPDFSSNNYNLNVGGNKLRVLWVTAAGSSKESGVLCYIDFKITGEGETELRFSDVLVLDEDTNEATVQTTPGKIKGTGELDDKGRHIKAAEDLIDALPDTIDCNNSAHRTMVLNARAAVAEAKSGHGAENSDFRNLSKLVDAENVIAKCDAIRAADDAIYALPALENLKLEDKSKVQEARRLVDAAKQLGAKNDDFQHLDKLIAAENRINELEKPKPITPPTGGVYFLLLGGVLFIVTGTVTFLKRRQLLSGR